MVLKSNCVFLGPTLQMKNRFFSGVMAKNNVKLWEKSNHIIESLPHSGILNDTILFRVPELMPRNSVLKISTILPSSVFICQAEWKREAWNQDTLNSVPYMFSEQKEKVITSNGNLSIFYAATDLSDKGLCITLPKTAPNNSLISIFVKERK